MRVDTSRDAGFLRASAAFTLAALLVACSSESGDASASPSPDEAAAETGTAGRGIFEDNGLAQEDLMGFPEVNGARQDLSPDLLAASKARGDLPCDLPVMPGASARESLPGQHGFVTQRAAPDVAAFYWAAAEAAGGFAMVGATPAPFARIHLPDGRTCYVSAQAKMEGSDFMVTDQGYMGLIEEGG